MNDRFKFRVWNNKMQKFHIVFSMHGIVNDTLEGYAKDDNFVLEQCTGLKDKNGKLIYEGDLIKCPTGIYRIAVDDFGLWTVIYNNNPFEGVGEWGDVVKEYAFNQNNVEIEVLGNIHENADLLELKQDD